MREVRGPVARRDRGQRHPGVLQRGGLEGLGVAGVGARRDGVPGPVQQGRGQVFDRAEALAEALGGLHLGHELLRHRLAGLVVAGVVGQDLGPDRPHLVDLRGVFDEVARDGGPGEEGVVDVREQAVQGMAELVEEGVDLVEGQQRRLAGTGPGDVEVVDDDGALAEQRGLVHQVVHPGAAALGGAGVEVAEIEADRAAVLLEDLEDPDVGVVAGQVGALGEAQPVQQPGGVEDTVGQHPVELEVRAHGGGVDVVLGLADLLRPVRPVPGGDLVLP